MFQHPAYGRPGYGAFDATVTFHVLPDGDVWAYTNMDKSMATVVYSAKLGRQVTSDDGYPIVSGGRITQLQGDTVSSEKTIEAAATKAKAQIAPPPAPAAVPAPALVAPAPVLEAPRAFVPADAMTVSVAPPAKNTSGGVHPYLVGALAALGLVWVGSKLMPRGA
jgi:hypothetical protein